MNFTSIRISILILFALSTRLEAQSIDAFFSTNPLLGGAGVAGDPDYDTIMINPAQLGSLPHTGAQLSWGLLNQEYQQRYPGFPAHSSNNNGLDAFPTPSGAYKFNRKFGITGFLLPFPLSLDIEKRGIPFVVLGQQNQVDLVAKGKSEGILLLGLGYAFSPAFSIGLRVNYAAFSAEFSTLESTSGSSLLEGVLKQQSFSAGLGLRLRLTRKLHLGLFVQGISTSVQDFQVTGGNLSTLGNPENANTTPGAEEQGTTGLGGKNESSTFANPIRFGVQARVTSKIKAMIDVEYKRKAERKLFSLVDLVEKPADTYDTISVFSGVKIELPKRKRLFVGYKNQPSSLGPGSPGENGKSGLGFLSLIENLAGAPTSPLWAVSAGYGQDFGKRMRKGRRSQSQMSGAIGFVYEEVSIGIDENGEQPGAYLVRNIRIPFKFNYRF